MKRDEVEDVTNKEKEEQKRKRDEGQSKVSDEDRLDVSVIVGTHRIGGQPGSDTPGTKHRREYLSFCWYGLPF